MYYYMYYYIAYVYVVLYVVLYVYVKTIRSLLRGRRREHCVIMFDVCVYDLY